MNKSNCLMFSLQHIRQCSLTLNQVIIPGTLHIVRNLENKVLFVWQFSSKGILDMLLLQCIFVLVQYCQVHFSIFNLWL